MNPQKEKQAAFTLIEMMLAAVLASIVMMAVGMLLISQWRAHSKFINEQTTMNEIALLSDIFSRNARDSVVTPTGTGTLTFGKSSTIASSIYFNSASDSIIYDPSLSTTGDELELLSDSIINSFKAYLTNDLVIMEVDIVEQELNKTNQYRLVVNPRNGVVE